MLYGDNVQVNGYAANVNRYFSECEWQLSASQRKQIAGQRK